MGKNAMGKKVKKDSKLEDLPNLPLTVDFDQPELYNQTRPLTCTIKGKRIILHKQNWPGLLVSIAEYFIGKNNPAIPRKEEWTAIKDRIINEN